MAKILLVEDNEMNRDMLSRRLERKGYEVEMAVDGRQGVDKAKTLAYDLVLMDMSLPEIDGWETTRLMRAAAETRTIPIIALTAHAMVGDRERAIGAGFDNYISKPLTAANFMKDLLRILLDIQTFSEQLGEVNVG